MEARLQQSVIDSATHSALPADLLIKGSRQLVPNSHFSKSVRKRIQVLEREHGITAAWAPESAEFHAGLLALVTHKVRHGQLAVERHVRDINVVELLHQSVYTRRKETRNLKTVRNVRRCCWIFTAAAAAHLAAVHQALFLQVAVRIRNGQCAP